MLLIELHPAARALVIKGVEDNPSRVVCCMAGPLYRFLAIVTGVAAEVPLGNLSVRGPAEGNAHVLQFVDHPGGRPVP